MRTYIKLRPLYHLVVSVEVGRLNSKSHVARHARVTISLATRTLDNTTTTIFSPQHRGPACDCRNSRFAVAKMAPMKRTRRDEGEDEDVIAVESASSMLRNDSVGSSPFEKQSTSFHSC